MHARKWVAACCVSVFFLGPVWAGQKITNNVVLSGNINGGTMSGSLGSVRASGDRRSEIGCVVDDGVSGACFATDDHGGFFCVFNNSALARMAEHIGPTSFISVAFDKSATCTSIALSNYSSNQPTSP